MDGNYEETLLDIIFTDKVELAEKEVTLYVAVRRRCQFMFLEYIGLCSRRTCGRAGVRTVVPNFSSGIQLKSLGSHAPICNFKIWVATYLA